MQHLIAPPRHEARRIGASDPETIPRQQEEYGDIVEESQLWAKLDSLEQLCAAQGIDKHGGLSRSNGCAQHMPTPNPWLQLRAPLFLELPSLAALCHAAAPSQQRRPPQWPRAAKRRRSRQSGQRCSASWSR